jgi:hypothetical protein
LLGVKACAELLGCSVSTVKAWDRGAYRVPWSVVKLLRLYRLGDLGALQPEWRGWSISRAGLVSPEGHTYERSDFAWWSLTCRQAEAFRQGRAAQRRATGRSVSQPPGVPVLGRASPTRCRQRQPTSPAHTADAVATASTSSRKRTQ